MELYNNNEMNKKLVEFQLLQFYW